MNIIKLTQVKLDKPVCGEVIKEQMYINTTHIHLFKSVVPTEQKIADEYKKLTNITVGKQHFYVAETPDQIQKTINFLQR